MSAFAGLLGGGMPNRHTHFKEWEVWKAEHPEEYEADLRRRTAEGEKQRAAKLKAEKKLQRSMTPAQRKAAQQAKLRRDLDELDKRATREAREERAAAARAKARREAEGLDDEES